MSSWRAATKNLRRTHQERGQPEGRQHLGLLEKKKDYRLRAEDYRKKQGVLKKLRLKAALRNPDEFNFGMINSTTKDGVHRLAQPTKKYTAKQFKQMANEDLSYLVSKRQTELKKVERLQSSLHCLDAPAVNTHTIFVDSESELKNFSPENYFNTAPELINRTYNRPKRNQLRSERDLVSLDAQAQTVPKIKSRILKDKKRRYVELDERMQRAEGLAREIEKVELKKKLMTSKGARVRTVKVDKDTGKEIVVYKWKKIRTK
jgi:U3 small nucleolar RNA-associated protein 11